ncbi:MAG: PCYCGC motif-containing (lipo)protein [Nitriliruptorales bacterium]|nr:PCYCGC motif-containing (lipo)protein [Nitriliruptorales bacterium]
MLQVAPGGTIALADLPVDHQRLYRAAADDPEAFTEISCYCGCEAFLDHRHLYDCFVRPSGSWERHATGCAVCLAEAEQVLEGRAGDVPIDEIGRQIDATFGGITDSTDT